MWTNDMATEAIWKVGFTVNSYGGKLGLIFLNYDHVNYRPDYVPATWVLNAYDRMICVPLLSSNRIQLVLAIIFLGLC